jgi:outer membrane immunogenic protein
MKKLLLASLAGLILTTGSTFAADIATPAPVFKAPPPPPPAASWTGCYVDGGAGYGLWNQDHSTTFIGGTSSVTTTDAGRGWLGRFGGGCDYQTPLFGNRLVVGVFGDYDFMSLPGSNTPDTINGATGSPVTFYTKETNAAYVGGRVGYLVNPTLLAYVDGGWTTTHFTNSPVITTAFGGLNGTIWSNYSPNGWFIGGGYEYGLNFDWMPIHGLFWRTEYRFSQYDSSELAAFGIASGAPNGNVEHITPYVQTITSSLVWRFNFNGPIAAADRGPALAYKAPPATPPAVGWTGCYADAGGGYGLFNQDHFTSTPSSAGTVTTTDGGRGWLGRVGGGCDYQTPLFNNRVVVGVFGDYDFMSLTGSNTPQLINIVGATDFGTVTSNTEETGAGYVGGRVGYLVSPTLLTYADGGWTTTHFTNSLEIRTASGTPSGFAWPSYSPGGWFLGGGAEYALSGIVPINGLFWRSEYRLASYSKTDVAEFFTPTGAPDGNIEHITPYVQTVTSGLVWRFNFGSPVAARY